MTTHLSLAFISSTVIELRLGTATSIATATLTLPIAWGTYIEVSATISSTVGTCSVLANGVTVIDFNGNTKNGGTNTTIDQLSIGRIANGSGVYIDDLYISNETGSAPYNTFLGDVRVATLSPTAAGASTQMTPDSGANFSRVNEIPYSASNYVSGATPAYRDTYTMADLPANVATVYAVQNNVIAKRTSTGAIAVKPAIKSGASIYYGTSTPVTTSDATYTDLRTTDPATSTAWTVSGVNNLESGLEIA